MTAANFKMVAEVIKALQEEPADVETLAITTGSNESSVRNLVRALDAAGLLTESEAPRMSGKRGPTTTLWAWRFG